ncbi:MAG TPA: bifunctional phosphopantothenoylcysteine decarboxylase/phosphopantothenate--cysteine ligase CoaBC [Chitinivibrionales bacterium]
MSVDLRIILGISGGIAAYKTPSLIRLFQKNDVAVKTVCTNAALTLVAQQTLRTISGYPVYTDNPSGPIDMAHIDLAKWADYMLVCPATANTLAKMAHGIADNLLTSLALSFEKRLIIAPAMNTAMWQNAVTRENVERLRDRGALLLPVGDGDLACGDCGPGRLIDLEVIVHSVLSMRFPRQLAGKKVLISSGPTCEPIDAVRVIGNRSSGKMGAALAHAARAAGAEVIVVSGPAAAALPQGVRVVKVCTALEMLNALEKEFDKVDICIMAAAVADFRPAQTITGKKHRDDSPTWNLELVANPDIAKHLGTLKKRQFLVGFSLETDDSDEKPLEKMNSKHCDLMVVNRVDSSLESDTTQIRLLYPQAPMIKLAPQTKHNAAVAIISAIAARMGTIHG